MAPTRKIDKPLNATNPGGNADVVVLEVRRACFSTDDVLPLLVDGFEPTSGALIARMLIISFFDWLFFCGETKDGVCGNKSPQCSLKNVVWKKSLRSDKRSQKKQRPKER